MGRAFVPHIITPDSALGGLDIRRSLRFFHSDEAYLRYEPGIAAASSTTFTFSAWIKRNKIGNTECIAGSNSGSNAFNIFGIDGNDRLMWRVRNSSSVDLTRKQTNFRLRDTNSWYHLLLERNTTLSTAEDRAKLYVNGVRATDWQTNTNDSQNFTYSSDFLTDLNIGRFQNSTSSKLYSSMYLAEYHYVDGQALDPSYFGYTESQTGIWRPKKYEGTHGQNGFYLDFSDNSGNTSTTIGKDRSGNGNNVTPFNISVSAGVGNDSSLDTPTNNFCTFDALSARGTTFMEPSEGGLGFSLAAHTDVMSSFVIPDSGKWYAEFVFTTVASGAVGVTNLNRKQTSGAANALNGINMLSGEIRVNDSTVQSSLTAIGANDVIGIKVDRDAGTVQFTNDGVNVGTPVLISSMNAPFDIMFNVYRNSSGGSTPSGYANFGQRPFSYLPSGFRSLCGRNMTTPTGSSIVDPKEQFDTVLYTGNGTTGQSVTGLEFAPDFVWIKSRSFSNNHHLFDTVRGPDKILRSSSTDAESTVTGVMSSFNSGGFTVKEGGGNNATNDDGSTFVAWCWKAGGSSNTYNIDGVGYATATAAGLDGGTKNPTGASVNTKTGFSIISYVASNGTNDTIYHGLKQAPEMIFTKDRDNSRGWGVYYSLPGGTNTNWARLDVSNAQGTNDSGETLGGVSGSYMNLHEDYFQPAHTAYANGGDNGSDNLIAYMWHSVPGYSKMGIYKGNGNANGVYVPLGFRPAWVMVKKTNGANSWVIYDAKRSTTNVIDNYLIAEGTDVDNTNSASNIDFLNDGFKFRSGYDLVNSGDYIYMAFAEQPGRTPYMAPTNAR